MKKFLTCGVMGWCLEVLWTGFSGFLHHDRKLMGTTSILMFPIYGMASCLSPVCRKLQHRNVLLRGGVYTGLIYVIEYASGTFLNKFQLCPWDYSRARFNIRGVIRLDYAPLWFLTGLLMEKQLGSVSPKSGIE